MAGMPIACVGHGNSKNRVTYRTGHYEDGIREASFVLLPQLAAQKWASGIGDCGCNVEHQDDPAIIRIGG